MNGPAMLQTFLVFFVGGLLRATAVISLALSGGIIWFDCLHDNPGHVCGDALLFTAISPVLRPPARNVRRFPAHFHWSSADRPQPRILPSRYPYGT
jgi:hypothetical protein